MKRRINRAAVIGSGIMGSGIACHLAGVGIEVLLLDIAPKELNDVEKKNGLKLSDRLVKNRLVNSNFQNALKLKPSIIYSQEIREKITLGNMDDDLYKIQYSDWIIEVVVEKLEIKQKVFGEIEKFRKEGTLISSNTSGIPIGLMAKGRTDDFKKNFCGTHFFNPVRYLKLLEIIPTEYTDPKVIDFFMNFGEKFLGKKTVVCKDTPAFIANRIGIFSMMNVFHSLRKFNLSVEEIDKLTGPVIGRPKSATFRTADVVGIDTLVHVANGLKNSALNDESNALFSTPDFIGEMIKNNWLGSKSGQGFYKKIKNKEGKTEILSLNLKTLEYQPQKKASFPTLEKTKTIENIADRFTVLIKGNDIASKFYRQNLGNLFSYAVNRIPEISDNIYKIDDALKAGFGWSLGPFEIWDSVGFNEGIKLIEDDKKEFPSWLSSIIEKKIHSFYRINDKGNKEYIDIHSLEYSEIPGQDKLIVLDNIRESKTIWHNSDSAIQYLGDGILNFEFRSKMNTLGGGVIEGLNHAIDLAEKEYDGLVIGNQASNFSVGANLMMIFLMAVEQDFDELNFAVKSFQDAMMRVKYSSIPCIVAPHGLTLGGGCEICLHADKVIAAAESYIGLVEFGVGVIPGGGGTKELTKRASQTFHKGDVELNRLQEFFMNIAMAKVSTSAHEAIDLQLLQKYKDVIVINKDRQLLIAKEYSKLLAEQGYSKPVPSKKIKVLGKQALGAFIVGIDSMREGGYISEHDKKIALKLASVMAGGELSEPSFVSEQYLLDLEREAFLSLCGEQKTLERIQYMLQNNKPLRN